MSGKREIPEPPVARPDLDGLEPYRTQRAAAPVRIHSNEWATPNPIGLYSQEVDLEGITLERYPSAPDALCTALGERLGVSSEQVLVGNGSNELLLYVFLLFGGAGRRVLLFEPTYSMYERLARIAGARPEFEIIGVPYDLTAERALAAVERERPDVIVICSPNNPTGTIVESDVIASVAAAAPRALVLVDEAYAEFAGITVIPLIARYPNLVVTRTFSKARAAAGLRLGALVADARVVERLRAVQLPYNVGVLTQRIGALLVAADDEVRARVEMCRVERQRLRVVLARTEGVESWPSAANFLLFRVDPDRVADVHARLLRRGVLVRDVSNAPGCAGCLRVSVGAPAENDRFISALSEIFPRARVA